MSELDGLVRNLAAQRALLEEAKRNEEMSQRLLDACYQSENLAKDREKRKSVEAMVEATYNALRTAAVDGYKLTGEKHPHPAVKVGIYQSVDIFDSAACLEHARLHLPQAVKLDTRAIEKVAKVMEVPGVKVAEEARATIATDLSAYLGGE